jgi:hypothetical protein
MELVNATPFAAERLVLQDKAGRDVLVAVAKCTYAAGPRGLRIADEQLPVQLGDTFHGEPGASSTALESDAVPWKPGTDVVAIGHAWAPRGQARELDVELAVGPVRRALRVFGERRWSEAAGAVTLTPPLPFERVPLVYERAFGGADLSAPDPRDHEVELRNPVGVGLVARRSRALDGTPLPNLEDPAALIGDPGDRPEPAGFGFIGRGWQPRAALAGTYDAAWSAERAPLLPDDFDERFYHGAHPRLVSRGHLRGDEEVRLVHLGPGGAARFRLPGAAPRITVTVGDASEALVVAFDTLILDVDALRVTLVWRGRRPLRAGELLRVRRVRVEA